MHKTLPRRIYVSKTVLINCGRDKADVSVSVGKPKTPNTLHVIVWTNGMGKSYGGTPTKYGSVVISKGFI